jgi:ATP-binding protein involved in chromosome partitioning
LFYVDAASKKILGKEVVASSGHEPGLLPVWLADEGVSAVIAGDMSSQARALCRQNRTEVTIGALEDDPEKAVLDCLEGKLATGNNICEH